MSHATLATYLPSNVPFHRKALHILSIAWMHSLGKTNAPHQKFVIPAMIVEIRTCLPAKDKYFDVQALSFDLICCSIGSQLDMESFLELRGRPRYQIGSDSTGIPDAAFMDSVSASVRPEGKKHNLSMLMERPEKASKSRRTLSTP